jgi:2-succinyl-5-enolpyruvyl-6-hydroxy-3-cyclohexene-1-carboxylate synthase
LLLLGDVSLLHDIGGLASARLASSPLVIAVIDNAGGRIFDQLPVAKLYAENPRAAELWLTPPELDLSHAAALFGLSYVAPASLEELREATKRALTERAPTLLHVRVSPHSAAELRARVLRAIEAEAPGAGG